MLQWGTATGSHFVRHTSPRVKTSIATVDRKERAL